VRRIARQAKTFVLIEGELYKRGATGIPVHPQRSRPGAATQDPCRHMRPSRGPVNKGSTGPQQWWTPRTSFVIVKGASSTLDKLTSRASTSRTIPIT
jgi:hypothetical protein